MKERISSDAPPIIRSLFEFPYWFFAVLYQGPRTLLDIASGIPKGIALCFDRVVSVDIDEKVGLNCPPSMFLQGDIRNIPMEDKAVDITFCFETIEHIEEQAQALRELRRVTKKIIVVGSINLDGPSIIAGVEIFKGKRNPFHLRELGVAEFKSLLESENPEGIEFCGSFYDGLSQEFTMRAGLHQAAYCSYGVANLEEL